MATAHFSSTLIDTRPQPVQVLDELPVVRHDYLELALPVGVLQQMIGEDDGRHHRISC